ncbi:MAG: rhodanese-like domain-containing protein [Akkermansiaceae bacterium]|nr:rhodanese-like domain-containing protein [Akkermansiaceae bacterium]
MAAAAAGFVAVSCTERSAAPTATPTEPPVAAAPAFKKPVRMTGRGEVTTMSFERFFELHQAGKILLFDARPAYFHAQGHIPGAINLPKDDCDLRIHHNETAIKAALAEGNVIVVYCTNRLCPDARTVARHISGFGYPAAIFSAGWEAWLEAGLPASSGG